MSDRDLAAEIDALKATIETLTADVGLMRRVVTDAKETSDAAFVQAAMAATHVASVIQRLNNLHVDVVAKVQG